MKFLLRFCIVALVAQFAFSTAASAASRFWVGGTGTWSSSNTTSWSATTGGSGGQSVPGSGDTATFDSNSGGGTVTVNAPNNSTGAAQVSISSLTLTNFTGTLDFSANNNNVTIGGGLSVTQTSSATLNTGSGTWTMNATNADLNFATVTGLTLSAGSTTFAFTSAASSGTRFITLSGASIGTVTISALAGTSGSTGFFLVTPSSGTIGTLSISGPNRLQFASGQTLTITNAFNWSGSASNPFIVESTSSTASTISVASGSPTMSYAMIVGMTFSGGATFTATNSYNVSGNTGITISAPSGLGGGHFFPG